MIASLMAAQGRSSHDPQGSYTGGELLYSQHPHPEHQSSYNAQSSSAISQTFSESPSPERTQQQQQQLPPQQHSHWDQKCMIGSPKLCRQMVIGFGCAAVLGLLFFTLGCVFIVDSIKSKNSVTIMLCIMGIVCGIIMVIAMLILGKLFVSRKCHSNSGGGGEIRQSVNPVCLHHCTVIYTPSQDQVNAGVEPPPAYTDAISSVPAASIPQRPPPNVQMTTLIHGGENQSSGPFIEVHYPQEVALPSPPKYEDAIVPLPTYGESVLR